MSKIVVGMVSIDANTTTAKFSVGTNEGLIEVPLTSIECEVMSDVLNRVANQMLKQKKGGE